MPSQWEIWLLRSAGKAAKHMCIYQILLRNLSMAVLPDCWWSWSSPASSSAAIPAGHPSRNFLNQVFSWAISPRSPHSSGSTRGLGAARPSKAFCLSFPSGYPGKIALWGDMDTSVVGRPCHDGLRAPAAAHGCTPAGASPSGEEGMIAAAGVTVPCCPSPACLTTAPPVPTGL